MAWHARERWTENSCRAFGVFASGIDAAASPLYPAYGAAIRSPSGYSAKADFSMDSGFYLRIEPEYIWLMPGNDFSADVDVFSNTKWEVTND